MCACVTSMSTSTRMYATNENANCVIGIRSNNLLKSCCELRILFGNYVYSSAHPVDVVAAAASVRWRRSVSVCCCVVHFSTFLSFFNFSKLRKFFAFFLACFFHIFFLLHFVYRASLFSFDLIWFLASFSPLSLSNYKFHFGVLVYCACECAGKFQFALIVKHSNEICKCNHVRSSS